ncbi:class I SAM-dependent methyltransferase [Actinomadura sp. 3N407]|uniref:class I SAM-dependent methyltransferase n=1 Tax=Actinomadura sp. 3N407 TaxID=3457423 RepID=UPI003FCC417D
MQNLLYEPVHQAVIRYIHHHVRPPSYILDAGCGTGRLLFRLADQYRPAHLVGVDPSIRMLDHATGTLTAHPNTSLVAAPAERLPFADGAFDLALITLSLRHWQNRQAGLTEISRVMAAGASLIIADAFPDQSGHKRTMKLRRSAPSLPDQMRRSLTAGGVRIDRITALRLTVPIADITLVQATKPSEGQ